eukprot:g27139.t1
MVLELMRSKPSDERLQRACLLAIGRLSKDASALRPLCLGVISAVAQSAAQARENLILQRLAVTALSSVVYLHDVAALVAPLALPVVIEEQMWLRFLPFRSFCFGFCLQRLPAALRTAADAVLHWPSEDALQARTEQLMKECRQLLETKTEVTQTHFERAAELRREVMLFEAVEYLELHSSEVLSALQMLKMVEKIAPADALERLRRPNTLRKHVKTWQKVGQWLEMTFGKPWPSTPSEFAEYIEAIVQEPCAKSAPEAAYKTLMFMEFGGEVEESAFLHRSSAVRNAIEEAQMKLASSEIRPSRKALLLPLAVVMAMEEMVISDDRLPFSRAYAWYRLVKIWAGLRFDDTKGIPNRSMELRENYLVGIIHKSKTSGPGKRVLQLPF